MLTCKSDKKPWCEKNYEAEGKCSCYNPIALYYFFIAVVKDEIKKL